MVVKLLQLVKKLNIYFENVEQINKNIRSNLAISWSVRVSDMNN
jgi:hypothetical protein